MSTRYYNPSFSKYIICNVWCIIWLWANLDGSIVVVVFLIMGVLPKHSAQFPCGHWPTHPLILQHATLSEIEELTLHLWMIMCHFKFDLDMNLKDLKGLQGPKKLVRTCKDSKGLKSFQGRFIVGQSHLAYELHSIL